MYEGNPLYDFASDLKAKHSPVNDYDAASSTWWRRCFPDAPTEAALRKHAQKFGKEGVAEVAAVYGYKSLAIEMQEDRKGRRRPTSPTLKSQVLELHRRGVVPPAIADTLDISDRRVSQILKDAA